MGLVVVLGSVYRLDAQQQASGLAGVVKDASGAVIPGVTVEAASPALIEKVRTVVTDDKGEYKIVNLVPGVYTVTFSLSGFSTVKRDGVELTAGFTGTLNADLRVGSLEETIVVTGAAPLVDTSTTRQQTAVTADALDGLPTSTKTIQTLVSLTPGFFTRAGTADVGGSAGTYAEEQNTGNFHGKLGNKRMFDGMRTNNMETDGSSTGFLINPLSVQEMTVETSGTSAESAASSVLMNMIPKGGGNVFKGGLNGLYTNHSLQSDNLNDDLRARGLTTTNRVNSIADLGGTLGGPIKLDRLWFFAAQRFYHGEAQIAGQFYNTTQGTLFYTPDLTRPMFRLEDFESTVLRLTWQASAKNKINAYGEIQSNWMHRHTFSGFAAPEAIPIFRFAPQALYQLTWASPLTSKLLLEAGAGTTISHWPNYRDSGVTPDVISVTELSTGLRYGAQYGVNLAAYGNIKRSDRFSQRASATYVTGSHAFKAGIQLDEGIHDNNAEIQGPDGVSYRFLNQLPNALVEDAVPFRATERVMPEMGLYAQDQWTLKKLTLNFGIRYDYLRAYVPTQSVPAGPFVPARNFGSVDCVPCWKDLNLRFGAAYDLFGNGRTALKFSMGRYLGLNQADIARLNNPMVTSVNEVTRTWTDTNGNFVPDCNVHNPLANGECGPISDQNFGNLNITTHYADDVLNGFGARDYTWDIGTVLQQELTRGLSMTAGYYHNWFNNFRVTDNLAVTPADYSPYCATAPTDPGLPGGGGYQVCGLYDVAPAKFGIVNNLVTQSTHYGSGQTRTNDFISLAVNGRLGSGITFGGGLDTGRTVDDTCFVIDSPQQLVNCHVITPFSGQTQIKLHGTYPLPGQFVVSAVFQRTPGPAILANYNATNAQIAPSLGRNLAACGTRVVCTSTATVPLIVPNTQFEDARTQLDVRATKFIKLPGKTKLQANVDVYNLLNASSILIINTTYGPQWRRPTSILDGRLVEFSAQFTF
jgi:hypothetical protein